MVLVCKINSLKLLYSVDIRVGLKGSNVVR